MKHNHNRTGQSTTTTTLLRIPTGRRQTKSTKSTTKLKNFTVFKDLKSESERGENVVFIDKEALTCSPTVYRSASFTQERGLNYAREQNIICSKTQLFAGHVVSSRPMKREEIHHSPWPFTGTQEPKKWAISELLLVSVLKWVLVLN